MNGNKSFTKYLIFLSIVFSAIVSFKQEKKVQEKTPCITSTKGTTTYLRKHLLFESLFESPSHNWSALEANASYAYQFKIDTVKRNGKGAARMELNINDSALAGHRVEFAYLPQTQKEGWYGFSNYLPEEFLQDHSIESIAQWHATPDFDLGENHGSPPIALCIINDQWCLDLRWDNKPVTNQSSFKFERVYLGKVVRNKWNDWVFRIKWGYDSSGILQVWKDNKLALDRVKMPNSFNDKKNPYFKTGIYKWDWSSPNLSATKKRVIYIDEVRIGDSLATLRDVKP